MLRRRLLLVPLVLFLLATPLIGDQIYLKSGKKIEGTVIAERPDEIDVKLASGEVKTFARSDVAMIQKTSAGAAEFKKRLKALDEDDVDGHLDLAAWCEANRMKRQRLTVLKKVVKIDPDCPEANRVLLRKWNGEKWVRDKAKGKVPTPQAGGKGTYAKIGLSLTTPTGWSANDAGEKGLTLSGPQRYRHDVTLAITLGHAAPAAAFSDADAGWTTPQDVTFGKLSGRMAEKLHRDGARRLKTREYALAGNGWMHSIRYTALEVEFADWIPHVDLVMRSLGVMDPKLDYKSPQLGIGFRFPQDGNWELRIFQNQNKEILFLVLAHKGEGPMGYCVMQYQQTELSDAAAADLDTALAGSFAEADVKAKKDTMLGPLKARIWEADTLQNGVPVFSMALAAADGKKGHLLRFYCHERTIETYRPTFDLVRGSFVFGVK